MSYLLTISSRSLRWKSTKIQWKGPPRTVYGILCGLKRHLGDKNSNETLIPLDAHDKRYGKLSTLFWLVWDYLFISGIVSVFI